MFENGGVSWEAETAILACVEESTGLVSVSTNI
jgi:hypothetical protein